MKAADDEALIRRFFENVINQRLLDETLASRDRALEYFTPAFQQAVQREGIADYWPDAAHVETMLDYGYQDIRYSIEDLVAVADRVVVRWAARGTHLATGRWLRWEGITFFAMEAGRITRVWAYADEFQLLRQLGIEVRLTTPINGPPVAPSSTR